MMCDAPYLPECPGRMISEDLPMVSPITGNHYGIMLAANDSVD